jgi:ABC-type lipoprotein export system ATPase subunit
VTELSETIDLPAVPRDPMDAALGRRPEPAPVLEAEGLWRVHGDGERRVVALRDAHVAIRRGELVAVVGRSGSGKSTLLHVLGTLDRPDAGEVRIEGRVVSALSERERALIRRRRLGFVLQFFNLLPTLTALENTAFPLLLDGVPDALERAAPALSRVGLAARQGHRPAEMSGGEQQRVALARALVTRPAAILADEPTGNLDSATGQVVLKLLRRSVDEGETVVMVTHDPEATVYADRVLRIADGTLL